MVPKGYLYESNCFQKKCIQRILNILVACCHLFLCWAFLSGEPRANAPYSLNKYGPDNELGIKYEKQVLQNCIRATEQPVKPSKTEISLAQSCSVIVRAEHLQHTGHTVNNTRSLRCKTRRINCIAQRVYIYIYIFFFLP